MGALRTPPITLNLTHVLLIEQIRMKISKDLKQTTLILNHLKDLQYS